MIDPNSAPEASQAAERFGTDLTAGINALPVSDDPTALEARFGLLSAWVLTLHGLEVDRATRLALLRQVAEAAQDAGWALKRAAAGDYTPDPKAARFPEVPSKSKSVTLSNLFDRWQAERKPAPSTVTTWRGVVSSLRRHLGHDDAIRVTPHDIVAWKDLLVSAGRPAKTINDTDLACAGALFRYGVRNKIIATDPTHGIAVNVKKQAGTGMLPYEDDEIARLLDLASRETHPARRWLPWLAVLTGARIGELAQAWGNQVRTVNGVPVLEIRPAPDGGTLKNEGSERTVPLHPALIEAGFIEFATRCGAKPMFYGRPAKPGSEGRHPSKGTSNHLAAWVRKQGFDNPRKAPSHAARHWFKSTCSRIGIPDSVADAIQGHADSSTAGTYRHFDLATLAASIAKVPVPQS